MNNFSCFENKMYIDQLNIILIYVQCDLKKIVIVWYGIIWTIPNEE